MRSPGSLADPIVVHPSSPGKKPKPQLLHCNASSKLCDFQLGFKLYLPWRLFFREKRVLLLTMTSKPLEVTVYICILYPPSKEKLLKIDAFRKLRFLEKVIYCKEALLNKKIKYYKTVFFVSKQVHQPTLGPHESENGPT